MKNVCLRERVETITQVGTFNNNNMVSAGLTQVNSNPDLFNIECNLRQVYWRKTNRDDKA